MILKETILSAFNKRGTLLKWLKKVEKLLNESTLIEITVEKINSTEAVIKLFFEDNTTIQSDPFNIDNLISNLSLFTEDVELTAGNNVGITITGNSKVNQSNVRAVMRIPIIGSDTVVIDVSEDEEHFEIRLDADIAQKIERSLVTPINRPQSTELVAVDNTGAQVMLEVGAGLTIDNGVLKFADVYDGTVIIEKAESVLGLRRFKDTYTPFADVEDGTDEAFYNENHFDITPIENSDIVYGMSPIVNLISEEYGPIPAIILDYYNSSSDTRSITGLPLLAIGGDLTFFGDVNVLSTSNTSVYEWLLANTEGVSV